MHTQTEYIEHILPYRMAAIDMFNLALDYIQGWDKPAEMAVYFNGELSIRGLSTGLTNPVVEIGIIHCRALLEFLGIKVDPKDKFKLIERKNKRADDYGIEDFSGPKGSLKKITVEQALEPYTGPREEAEKALLAVINTANKGLAHTTTDRVVNEYEFHLYEIASRAVPTLMANYFYYPLRLDIPNYKIQGKKREDA